MFCCVVGRVRPGGWWLWHWAVVQLPVRLVLGLIDYIYRHRLRKKVFVLYFVFCSIHTHMQSLNYAGYTEAKSFGNAAALLSIAAILYRLLLFAFAGIFTTSVLIVISFCGVFTGRDPRCD